MKTAVFQIDEGNGAIHLICVPTKSLRSACRLERCFQVQADPRHEVKLLGRFNSVRIATSEEDAETLILADERDISGLDAIVEGILCRASRP